MGFKKGNKINLGKKCKPETRVKIGLANKGRKPSLLAIINSVKARKGKKLSLETRKKLSIAGKKKFFSKEHRKHLSEALVGKIVSEITKKKISTANKGRIPNREIIARRLRRKPISTLEQRVLNTIDKYNLPYKFVGNGKFFIERKCPDFVNTNGEKIAVEVYARRHKELFRGGLENWKKDRLDIFKKYGWSIIFIEEWQTNNDEGILKLLKGGGYPL